MVIGCAKDLVVILLMCTVMINIFCMTSLTAISEELVSLKEGNPETKIRHKKKIVSAGKGYKTKEEIEKPPSEDHPCNLTRTSLRISFPEMKGELFVNLLGYKEPNLVHLLRFKGLCRDIESPIACIATKVRQNTEKMVVKAHRGETN